MYLYHVFFVHPSSSRPSKQSPGAVKDDVKFDLNKLSKGAGNG